MTEAQARKLCTDRQRNPDRDMTGPDGPMKAWMLYTHPSRAAMVYLRAFQRDREQQAIESRTAPLDHGLVQSYPTETKVTRKPRMART